MEIYLRVDGDRIIEASFFTDGCRFSRICGQVAARLAEQCTLDEAVGIEGDSIVSVLGRVPEEEAHCADLAAETVRAAVHQWMLKWRSSR
jgi:nitrogen fixation NifU-like protein